MPPSYFSESPSRRMCASKPSIITDTACLLKVSSESQVSSTNDHKRRLIERHSSRVCPNQDCKENWNLRGHIENGGANVESEPVLIPPTIVRRKRSVSRIACANDFPDICLYDDFGGTKRTTASSSCDFGQSPTGVTETLGVFDVSIPISPPFSLPSQDNARLEAVPITPPPKRTHSRQWSSFHEEGRDWGTSKGCDTAIIEQLLTQFEEQDEGFI
eukprot:scaffold4821_cov76-Cylindrotheca_fusiformis.AAC.1